MRKETNPILCVLITLLLVGRGSATVIPTLDLRSLVNAADMIAVGQITQVTDTGNMSMNIRGHDMLVSIMKVQMRVDKVIKGDSEADIEFQLLLPVEGMGYRSVPRDSYRLVFLKQEAGHLKPASPYYPSFPAVSDYSVRGGSPFEAVTGNRGCATFAPRPGFRQNRGDLARPALGLKDPGTGRDKTSLAIRRSTGCQCERQDECSCNPPCSK
jgi:hypothetical protein